MTEPAGAAVWWIELIKVAPALIAVLFCVVLVVRNRSLFAAALARLTKLKALGVEAEFATKDLDRAIAAQGVAVPDDDRRRALRRLETSLAKVQGARVLWVDDQPSRTRHERALLEKAGLRVTTVATTADGLRALTDDVFLLAITDLAREGRPTEGLDFVRRAVEAGIDRPTIAYVATDQWGLPRPAYLFAITNRPDALVHFVCDIVDREDP